MDRVQFVSSINGCEDQFFDHIMIAYNIIDNENDVYVTQSANLMDSSISFMFKFCAIDTYNRILSKIEQSFHGRIELYGSIFNIDIIYQNINDLSICIRIRQL